MEHGDCYRGCFVGEKIAVVSCAENGGRVVFEALFVSWCVS